MKSENEMKLYKKMYYLNNKKKLCDYSKNYYTYKKCRGNLTNDQINENFNKFLKSYKKNKTNSKNVNNKCSIKKENIIISFK